MSDTFLVCKKRIPVEARGPISRPELVTTAHGRVRAEAGDYILRDPATNDTWPIKPDIYANTYELWEKGNLQAMPLRIPRQIHDVPKWMKLPPNPAYPDFNELHLQDDWCPKAGCIPATLYEVSKALEIAANVTSEAHAPATPATREPHDGWMNAWLYENGAPEESEFYRFAWHSKMRKLAGDWADFRARVAEAAPTAETVSIEALSEVVDRLKLATAKLAEFGVHWNGEGYVFDGKDQGEML